MRRVPAGKDINGAQILKHILSNLTDCRTYWPGSKCQQKKRWKVTSLKSDVLLSRHETIQPELND